MEERIAVVNEKNHVVEYKDRKNLSDKEAWRAACVWIEDGKGNVLMQKRTSDRKVDPSTWTCAAIGTVTGDDSYEATAKRELYEEIGVKNVPLKPANSVFCRSSFGSRWYKGFTAVCNKPLDTFTIQEEEVSEIQWLNKEKVIQEIKAGDPKYASTASCYIELFGL
jgi:isopentenyldiphosphate isomerase